MLAAALTLATLAHPFPPTDTTLDVHFKGRVTELGELGSRLPGEVAEPLVLHAQRYADWAEEFGYEIGVSEDGRVLLFAESVPTIRDRMKLVEKALAAFDELLPPVDRSGSDETFDDGAFGEAHHRPDSAPIVLFEVDTPDAYKALALRVGEQEPKLSAWAASQAEKPGFLEARVPAAGWQRIPRDFDLDSVWRTKNELVNRLARLALHRSYGPMPTWLSVGLAWQVEMEVMGTIYSFPYRTEFVSVVEHEGWKAELKSRFRRRKKDDLRMDEFANWRINTWDEERASVGWGVADFLAQHRTDALPKIAEDFRLLYKDGFRWTNDDGTWGTNPTYQVPLEEQLRVMEEHTGDELLPTLTAYLGSSSSPVCSSMTRSCSSSGTW
ncbi:MAG: hypothetical protein AAGB93_10745 [Planctomycetota bacterium]